MNREDVNIASLLGKAMTSIRTREYLQAVEPLLEIRRFVITSPLQVTEGEKLALANMENSVSAALLCETCGVLSNCQSMNVLACYNERVKR